MKRPPSLRKMVIDHGTALSFQGSHLSFRPFLIGALGFFGAAAMASVGMYCLLAALVNGTTPSAGLLILSVAAVALVGAGLCFRDDQRGRLWVRPGAVNFGGGWIETDPSSVLTLRGDPGTDVRLCLGTRTLRWFLEQDAWTYHQLSDLGTLVAHTLGVVFEDHRPPMEWQHWQTDPRYRARRRLELLGARGLRQASRLHSLAGLEPEQLIQSHQSVEFELSGGSFVLTARQLVFNGRLVPWAMVDGVALVFERDGRHGRGILWIGIDGELILIGQSEQVETHRVLIWAGDTLRQAYSAASAIEVGGEADVPATLRRLRQSPFDPKVGV